MQKEVTIIDYGLGNIKSLYNAFEYLGAKVNKIVLFKKLISRLMIIIKEIKNEITRNKNILDLRMTDQIILFDDGDLIRSTMTASWLKKMGYLSEENQLYGDLTSIENLFLYGTFYEIK